eukprot:SM000067S20368  [mRNA]  locus=s67:498320:501958:- [translate_table: standard]
MQKRSRRSPLRLQVRLRSKLVPSLPHQPAAENILQQSPGRLAKRAAQHPPDLDHRMLPPASQYHLVSHAPLSPASVLAPGSPSPPLLSPGSSRSLSPAPSTASIPVVFPVDFADESDCASQASTASYRPPNRVQGGSSISRAPHAAQVVGVGHDAVEMATSEASASTQSNRYFARLPRPIPKQYVDLPAMPRRTSSKKNLPSTPLAPPLSSPLEWHYTKRRGPEDGVIEDLLQQLLKQIAEETESTLSAGDVDKDKGSTAGITSSEGLNQEVGGTSSLVAGPVADDLSTIAQASDLQQPQRKGMPAKSGPSSASILARILMMQAAALAKSFSNLTFAAAWAADDEQTRSWDVREAKAADSRVVTCNGMLVMDLTRRFVDRELELYEALLKAETLGAFKHLRMKLKEAGGKFASIGSGPGCNGAGLRLFLHRMGVDMDVDVVGYGPDNVHHKWGQGWDKVGQAISLKGVGTFEARGLEDLQEHNVSLKDCAVVSLTYSVIEAMKGKVPSKWAIFWQKLHAATSDDVVILLCDSYEDRRFFKGPAEELWESTFLSEEGTGQLNYLMVKQGSKAPN